MLYDYRYIITDIIGNTDGIGVENLRGSGTIAGESSQAYDEIITISMVRMGTFPSKVTGKYTGFLPYILAGNLPCHRDRCIFSPFGTESHPGGELPHYPDWSKCSQQGLVVFALHFPQFGKHVTFLIMNSN